MLPMEQRISTSFARLLEKDRNENFEARGRSITLYPLTLFITDSYFEDLNLISEANRVKNVF